MTTTQRPRVFTSVSAGRVTRSDWRREARPGCDWSTVIPIEAGDWDPGLQVSGLASRVAEAGPSGTTSVLAPGSWETVTQSQCTPRGTHQPAITVQGKSHLVLNHQGLLSLKLHDAASLLKR